MTSTYNKGYADGWFDHEKYFEEWSQIQLVKKNQLDLGMMLFVVGLFSAFGFIVGPLIDGRPLHALNFVYAACGLIVAIIGHLLKHSWKKATMSEVKKFNEKWNKQFETVGIEHGTQS